MIIARHHTPTWQRERKLWFPKSDNHRTPPHAYLAEACDFSHVYSLRILQWSVRLSHALVFHMLKPEKLLLTYRKLSTVALSYHLKNQRKFSTPGEIFTVHTYKCFMENKNMIKTFCGCKSSERTLSFIKI